LRWRPFIADRHRTLGLLLLLTFAVRLPSFLRPLMDIDEAEYAAIACRMLDGGLPYRDAVEIKLPGILYLYSGVFALFGRYNMLAIHLVCAACAFATALVCRRIAQRVVGERAGWWAAALYALFSVGFYSKMQAANTEMFAVLPGALAVLVYLRARETSRPFLVFVAGLLCGVATLFKQPAALLAVALAAGGIARGLRREHRLAPEVAAAGALMAGGAAVLAVTALCFWARGILGDVVFWTWIYIWRHYFPSVQDSFVVRLLGNAVPFALSMSPVVFLAAFARRRALWPVRLWLVGMVAAGFVGGRMYGHYFLLAVPALCVLAGVGAARWWPPAYDTVIVPGRRLQLRHALIAVTALLAVGQFVGALAYEGATDSLWSPRPDYRQAGAYLRRVTTPAERVFVWGWFPALYLAGDRCPSTRFVYAHHLAGYTASISGHRGHSVPEGWLQLMDDLRRSPPAYVLDTSHGAYQFEYAPIESYLALWTFVSQSYAFEAEIAGVRFYRRRQR
jgi:4-amino-4-deoxy-L-arabinose transferase-like glycosyltransferase